MARSGLLLLLALCAAAAATVAQAAACTDTVTGYSSTFGKRKTAKLERWVNTTAAWKAKGRIGRLSVYYSAVAGCVQGVKPTFGNSTADAALLGMQSGLAEKALALAADETVTKVQLRARDCLEYVRFVTSKARVLAAGNAASNATLVTAYPNRAGGFLGAVRGYEQYARALAGVTVRGPLSTFQLVWAACVANTTLPLPVSSPSPSPAPSASPSPPPSSTSTASTTPTTTTAAVACPAVPAMCNASETSLAADAYCPATAPLTRAACASGCCVSSGRCGSSACALAGLGGEVPNTVCYGLNRPGGVGFTAQCTNLGCKLAVPGCTTDLLGGSCVGTVTNLTAAAGAPGAPGAALLGYPCLDVTPSSAALTAVGADAAGAAGLYVKGLWTVCNCFLAQATAPVFNSSSPSSTVSSASANSTTTAAARLSGLLHKFDAVAKFDVTNLTALVEAAFDIPFEVAASVRTAVSAAEAKAAKLLVLPKLPPANATRALALIGRLVARGGETVDAGTSSDAAGATGAALTSPFSFLSDLVRGAGAVSAAANSTNPLGALLGALAPRSSATAGLTNPLAGLRNLVAAFLPGDAPVADKADLLSSVLSVLSSGSKAAPAAELVGVVAKLVAVAAPDGSLADDVAKIAANFKMPSLSGIGSGGANGTGLVEALVTAAQEGRAAARGAGVDLAGVFGKLYGFATKGIAAATAALGNSTAITSLGGGGLGGVGSLGGSVGAAGLASLLAGAEAFTQGATTLSGASNVVKAFTNLFGGSAPATTTTTTTTTPAANSTSTLQGLLNAAANLVPFLQTASAAGTAVSTPTATASDAGVFNTFLALVNAASGSPAASGSLSSVLTLSNLQKLASAAGQVSPLLQALGANTTATATTGGGVTSSAAANALLSLLKGGAGSSPFGAGGVSLATLGQALSVAGQLAPVIGALSTSVGSGDMTAFTRSVQSFLETL